MIRRRARWDADMDEYLVKQAKAGEKFRIIASGLGVTPKAAWERYIRVCNQRGISPYRIKRKVHSEEARARVVSMRLRGLTSSQVAAVTGLRVNQVVGIWNTWRDRDQYRRQAA